MKPVLLSVLVSVTILGTAAEAAMRNPGSPHAVMAPLEQAATACFADTVVANPGAMAHARAGRWYQAAGVIGFLCRPEVDAMIRAHDRIYGAGTGDRYFKNAYAKHLDRELAVRLQPLIERKAVASAEPGLEKAERPEGVAAQ